MAEELQPEKARRKVFKEDAVQDALSALWALLPCSRGSVDLVVLAHALQVLVQSLSLPRLALRTPLKPDLPLEALLVMDVTMPVLPAPSLPPSPTETTATEKSQRARPVVDADSAAELFFALFDTRQVHTDGPTLTQALLRAAAVLHAANVGHCTKVTWEVEPDGVPLDEARTTDAAANNQENVPRSSQNTRFVALPAQEAADVERRFAEGGALCLIDFPIFRGSLQSPSGALPKGGPAVVESDWVIHFDTMTATIEGKGKGPRQVRRVVSTVPVEPVRLMAAAEKARAQRTIVEGLAAKAAARIAWRGTVAPGPVPPENFPRWALHTSNGWEPCDVACNFLLERAYERAWTNEGGSLTSTTAAVSAASSPPESKQPLGVTSSRRGSVASATSCSSVFPFVVNLNGVPHTVTDDAHRVYGHCLVNETTGTMAPVCRAFLPLSGIDRILSVPVWERVDEVEVESSPPVAGTTAPQQREGPPSSARWETVVPITEAFLWTHRHTRFAATLLAAASPRTATNRDDDLNPSAESTNLRALDSPIQPNVNGWGSGTVLRALVSYLSAGVVSLSLEGRRRRPIRVPPRESTASPPLGLLEGVVGSTVGYVSLPPPATAAVVSGHARPLSEVALDDLATLLKDWRVPPAAIRVTSAATGAALAGEGQTTTSKADSRKVEAADALVLSDVLRWSVLLGPAAAAGSSRTATTAAAALLPLNLYLWTRRHHSLWLAGRWCPCDYRGVAVMVEGVWRWLVPAVLGGIAPSSTSLLQATAIRQRWLELFGPALMGAAQGGGSAYKDPFVRLLVHGVPLSLPKRVLLPSAFPRSFLVDGAVLAIEAPLLDAAKLSSAVALAEAVVDSANSVTSTRAGTTVRRGRSETATDEAVAFIKSLGSSSDLPAWSTPPPGGSIATKVQGGGGGGGFAEWDAAASRMMGVFNYLGINIAGLLTTAKAARLTKLNDDPSSPLPFSSSSSPPVADVSATAAVDVGDVGSVGADQEEEQDVPKEETFRHRCSDVAAVATAVQPPAPQEQQRGREIVDHTAEEGEDGQNGKEQHAPCPQLLAGPEPRRSDARQQDSGANQKQGSTTTNAGTDDQKAADVLEEGPPPHGEEVSQAITPGATTRSTRKEVWRRSRAAERKESGESQRPATAAKRPASAALQVFGSRGSANARPLLAVIKEDDTPLRTSLGWVAASETMHAGIHAATVGARGLATAQPSSLGSHSSGGTGGDAALPIAGERLLIDWRHSPAKETKRASAAVGTGKGGNELLRSLVQRANELDMAGQSNALPSPYRPRMARPPGYEYKFAVTAMGLGHDSTNVPTVLPR